MDQPKQLKTGSVLSTMFLVGGTCIGGGMLALPVTTGVLGFLPSVILMLICWAMMTLTGLLLLEVNLWLEEGAHMISMTSTFLGRWGKFLAWILYLFIAYASLVGYTDGGGKQIADLLVSSLGGLFTLKVSYAAFLIFFLGVIALGSHVVGRVNTILFIGMVVAYFGLIGTAGSKINFELLSHKKWGEAWMAIPLLLTSFSFQTMVPSLTPYLRGNAKRLRLAIIGGTTLALCIYLLWEALVLGVVPVEGARGLREALVQGEPATFYLKDALEEGYISSIAQFFSFFALVTSFLGIALGLYDFLSDGLKIPEKGWGKLLLVLLIGVPTYFITLYLKRAFHVAMDLSGGIGDAILSGMMPVMMVWIGRYQRKMESPFRVRGGKCLLVITFLFFLGVFVIEILSQLGYLQPSFAETVTLDY